MSIRHPEKINNPINPIKKKPSWIRSRILNSQNFFKTREIINRNFSDSFSLRRGTIYKMELDKKSCIINKNTLLNKLGKINFDIIIDLNIFYESSIEDFISNQKSNYKIGFKHDKSDLLYNVQLDISKSQIAEKGYQQILDLI